LELYAAGGDEFRTKTSSLADGFVQAAAGAGIDSASAKALKDNCLGRRLKPWPRACLSTLWIRPDAFVCHITSGRSG
jgi:hypothetical protein